MASINDLAVRLSERKIQKLCIGGMSGISV
jgi:hypothetical protein